MHLTEAERQAARRQTAEWRNETGLSQRDLALRLNISESNYRGWESGPGPSRNMRSRSIASYAGSLPESYRAGQAMTIWGWQPEEEMTYEQVAGLLRKAGFLVPDSQAPGPAVVLWVHRLRHPNLVHGVFALAAAAATRAGLAVHLLVDDIDVPLRQRRGMQTTFDSKIRSWFEFASGRTAQLTTQTYSAIVTDELLSEHGWAAVDAYLNADVDVLEFLLASKVVSPLLHRTNAEESVLSLVRSRNSARRLTTPLRNWLVFDHEIASLLGDPQASPVPIVTLGGEDEETLWDLWDRGCSDQLSDSVQHIYLRPLPIAPWDEEALAVTASRTMIADFLRSRTGSSNHADLLEWLCKAAIGLPAALSPSFAASLDPPLTDTEALTRGPASRLLPHAPDIAAAMVDWLSA